jgi:hypothetical protein
MTITSLDSIVNNILLKRGYPYHYYIQFLVGAKDIMREIAFDQPIFSVRQCVLPVDQATNRVDLPNDWQDTCRVSGWFDQYIRPLVEDNNLQLIQNFDSDFDPQPYAQGIAIANNQSVSFATGYLNPYSFTTYWNSYGENVGRYFGGVGAMADTYRVDKTNRQIKINENLFIENIVLEYISDGMDADSATQIDSYAQFAIEAGAMWQFKEHNRTYSEGEAQAAKRDYELERQRLSARLSDLDIIRLKRIVQGNTRGIQY